MIEEEKELIKKTENLMNDWFNKRVLEYDRVKMQYNFDEFSGVTNSIFKESKRKKTITQALKIILGIISFFCFGNVLSKLLVTQNMVGFYTLLIAVLCMIILLVISD